MDDGNRFGWNWKFLVLNLLVGGNFDINDIIIKETMSKSKIKFLDTRRRQMCVFLCLFAVNVRVCVSVYLCMCVCVWQCAFNTVCTSLRVYMCVCVSLSLSLCVITVSYILNYPWLKIEEKYGFTPFISVCFGSCSKLKPTISRWNKSVLWTKCNEMFSNYMAFSENNSLKSLIKLRL